MNNPLVNPIFYSDDITFGFLTYLSRSGSTFLSNLLNEYQDICVTIEGGLPAELFGILGYKELIWKNKSEVKSYLESVKKISKLNTWPISIDEILKLIPSESPLVKGDELLKFILKTYQNEVKPSAKVIIYKGNPIMPWYISQIPKSMNDWHILHLIRDPRSVYASQKNNYQPYTNQKFTNSPVETAYEWNNGIQAVENCSSENVLNIKYEDLITDMNSNLNKIIEFFKVGGSKVQSNSFKSLIPDEEKSIHKMVGDNPDKNRIDSWKNELSHKEIQLVEAVLRDKLKRYDYDLYLGRSDFIKPIIFYEKIKFTLKRIGNRAMRIIRGVVTDPKYYCKKMLLHFKK